MNLGDKAAKLNESQPSFKDWMVRKRVRKTAAQLREGKEGISRTSIPEDERKTNEELIMLGLQKMKNIERWEAAPYCFNQRSKLYEDHWYLYDKTNSSG